MFISQNYNITIPSELVAYHFISVCVVYRLIYRSVLLDIFALHRKRWVNRISNRTKMKVFESQEIFINKFNSEDTDVYVDKPEIINVGIYSVFCKLELNQRRSCPIFNNFGTGIILHIMNLTKIP